MGNKKLLMYCVLAIMLILALRDLTGLSLNIYLQIVLLSVPLLILDKDNTLYYTFFVMTMVRGVVPYYLGVALLMITFRYWHSFSFRNVAFWVLFVIMEILHSMMYSSTHIIPEFLSYFSALGLFILILSLPLDRVRSLDCIKWYIYGMSFVLAIMFLRSYLLSGDLTQAVMNRQVFDTDLDEQLPFFSDNANNVGLFSITILSCLVLGRNRIQMPLPLWITCLVISFVAGMLTISRTWLFVLGLVVLMYVFTKSNKLLTALALVFLAAVVIIPNIEGGLIYSLFQARLTDDTMASGGLRTEVFSSFHEEMFSNVRYLISGVGALEYDSLFKLGSPHNMIQQIFVCYGVIGLVVFYKLAANYIKDHSTFSIPFLYHIPFISVFIFLQTDQFLTPYHCMFPLLIAALCFNIYTSEDQKLVYAQ